MNRRDTPSRAFQRLALAVGAWCVLATGLACFLVFSNGDRVPQFGWTAAWSGGVQRIRVAPNAPQAAALRTGDVVVAFNGDRRVAAWSVVWARSFVRGTEPYTMTVRRADRELTLTLAPAERKSPADFRLSLWLLIDGVVWCVLVAFIALFRSEQPVARVAFAAGATMGLVFLRQASFPAAYWQPYAVTVLAVAIYPIWPMHFAFGYDFYVRFPANLPPPRALAWLRIGLYATCAVIALASVSDLVVAAFGPGAFSAMRLLLAPVDDALMWMDRLAQFVVGVGSVAALTYNYRHVERPDDRRRLRWILWGTIVGLAPFMAVSVMRALTPFFPVLAVRMEWSLPANVFTIVIPIAVGYAIVKHRVFDITFAVRRGLQYLLAKNALRVLLFLPVAALVYGVVVHGDEPVGRLLLHNRFYIYCAIAAGLGLRFRTALTRWLDRRFFREAYDRERVLVGLLDNLGDLESASGVSKLVSRELEAAFHPRCLFIWYREGTRPHLALSYSSGGYIRTAELAPGSPLVRLAERAGGTVDVRTAAAAALPAADREWLIETGVELMFPIAGRDRDVLGLLMLGGKKSDEPYSSDDVKFLQALVREIGLARENVQLKDRVDEARRVRHDVLAKLDPERVNLLHECPVCGACYDAGTPGCPADGAELTLSLPIERTIDGKYRLDRLIGKGGMGVVYEAVDVRLTRPVAVKVLLGRTFGDRHALRRFEREAQAAARLAHPNIVTVYDFGPVGAEGAFLVMELVRGRTLRVELQTCGPRPPQVAAGWFAQAAAGITAAHAHGVVHRDLKPENVILPFAGDEAGVVKVVDFGLAKIQAPDEDAPTSLTHAGTVMGTIGYMAPEQLTGAPVDARTDIFALGVIVAETITGTRPFEGRTLSELLVAMARPVRLPGRGPAWRRLETVIQCACAEHPQDRYPAVDAFMADLLPALEELAPAWTS